MTHKIELDLVSISHWSTVSSSQGLGVQTSDNGENLFAVDSSDKRLVSPVFHIRKDDDGDGDGVQVTKD